MSDNMSQSVDAQLCATLALKFESMLTSQLMDFYGYKKGRMLDSDLAENCLGLFTVTENMKDMDLETSIWRRAAHAYHQTLAEVIREGLNTYKRSPGIDDSTRLYEAAVGHHAFLLLRGAMLAKYGEHTLGPGYVELRSRLRWHIRTHLLRQLVADGFATTQMRDSLFASDIGL